MKKYTNKLFCFSPTVMLATFVIEIAMAGYTVWRYKLGNVTRLVVAMLVFLAVFQLAEYMVCGGIGLAAETWSRIGYVAITTLPPLGIHLAYELSGVKKRPLLIPAYISGILFAAFFIFVRNSHVGNECLGNYVIFQIAPEASWLYGLYYYGFIIAGAFLGWNLAQKATNKFIRRAHTSMTFGYLAFLIPTTTVNLLSPETLLAIPSIMCGFAVLFALSLTFWVMPSYRKAKKQK